MWSWITKIFTSEKAINKGLGMIEKAGSSISSGIDMAIFTSEEKSLAGQKQMDSRMTMVEKLQDEFLPRSKARRLFATLIYGNFFFHGNLWLWFRHKENIAMADTVKDLLAMELQLTLLVSFFYYGYYGVKQILKK